MATLTTTFTESVTLNGSTRGSTNIVSTDGIVDVFERILTCAHSNTTTITTFATTPHTSAGALDVENTAYVRITNLSTTDALNIAIVGTATNYQVKLRPLASHVLFNGEAVFVAEADTSPGFTSFENLASIQARPTGATDIQVEMFVALT
ncbi:MAG: hypothetical protein Unbinned7837contig1000_6 [Prokaryotic dsDNA virus sp.]|nr:MAG: hypothetical protein Unbinned7837contig1000_6 [Prokaryotic dsDNA virus sp.]|tara:strand:+ start:74 stop:523 length:450 start_codon:yes stop_codon:yes gene_type:complete